MPEKTTESQKARKQFSQEYEQQALLRAAKDRVTLAACDLGLQPAQLYAWRGKSQQQAQDGQAQQVLQAEHARIKRELARLEEENAFLKKAAAYFAKQPK